MTKNEILKKSLQTIKNNRAIKITECQNYKQSCYSNKEVLDIANKLGEIKIKIAKAQNDNEDITSLEFEKKLLLKDFLVQLKLAGKDPSLVIPHFDCEKCNDTGLTSNGDMCECLKKLFIKNLLNETGIDLEKYPDLKNINLDKYENKEEIQIIIKNLLNIKKTNYNTILFTGATGTGKTYISKCFAKTLCENEILTRYYSSSEINKKFCEAHFNINNLNAILSDVYDAEALIIDDFGAEAKYKHITIEYFLDLLNERQSKNKLTLITTNLTLNDIKDIYTERFLSRLLDKEISLKYNFKGKDLRI